MPWHVKAKLQGRPGPEAGQIFQEWAQLPVSNDEYMAEVSELQKKYFPTASPLPGVPQLLSALSLTTKPHIESALATSSHRSNFELKTTHHRDMFSIFDEDKRVLGDDSRIPKGRGKPAPDIYLLALKTINDSRKADGDSGGIRPEECLVFEDSVPGVGKSENVLYRAKAAMAATFRLSRSFGLTFPRSGTARRHAGRVVSASRSAPGISG